MLLTDTAGNCHGSTIDLKATKAKMAAMEIKDTMSGAHFKKLQASECDYNI